MQDLFGSVRRSLVFKSSEPGDDGGFGGFVEKIGSSIRKSRIGLFSRPSPPPALPPPRTKKDDAPPIRWRKGELIGCGAFGRVYMGMNLDSGELIAVKQAHIRELEEEVKLLKNLSHPNIVRYLGTGREDDSLNILLEFVPGGSISSLLGKFGSFPESVIRMYTKQLLLGLEYLHQNGIMHRDIKGANILVDNKGCIKLADFGASKKVVELATINGAKSMKGTPYWMAPEVILQTGHSFSADIWSVGCTVIEMATGKPPWSQQYQEHPFVTGEYQEPHLASRNSVRASGNLVASSGMNLRNSMNYGIRRSTCAGLKDVCDMGTMKSSTVTDNLSRPGSYWGAANSDDDMCQIDDKDDFGDSTSAKFNSILATADLNKSGGTNFPCQSIQELPGTPEASGRGEDDFSFPSGPLEAEDDDEVTESKIRAFLDEKALDLKKLQTPLFEEFLNTMHAGPTNGIGAPDNEHQTNSPKLPPKSRSPKRLPSRRLSTAIVDAVMSSSPRTHTEHIAKDSGIHNRVLQEIQPPQVNDWKVPCDPLPEAITPSRGFAERQRKWKQELDEELERKRGKDVATGGGRREVFISKGSSPNSTKRTATICIPREINVYDLYFV
ncbi:hypothetical protein Tsubulata_012655 [Turnera subulata]|uniref:mitogen-activated protein kinase kinase kinase n=1 Tax=Turnera subulata TaxID=218843 RepID=A0A9Q0FLM0_9ROSI|nr:hypothetical protein Tsubulata_012655 [Turnera subulata]